MSDINKQSLKHLANLSRLQLSAKEKSKFLEDLQKILDYFKELQEVDVKNVPSVTGGTDSDTILGEDEKHKEGHFVSSEKIREQFPEKENDFLKVPPVFE